MVALLTPERALIASIVAAGSPPSSSSSFAASNTAWRARTLRGCCGRAASVAATSRSPGWVVVSGAHLHVAGSPGERTAQATRFPPSRVDVVERGGQRHRPPLLELPLDVGQLLLHPGYAVGTELQPQRLPLDLGQVHDRPGTLDRVAHLRVVALLGEVARLPGGRL